jgi:hypothetical protein
MTLPAEDPLASIRANIEETRREGWPAEQARRLAAVLAEAGADADVATRLPELAWGQAVEVANERVREAGGSLPLSLSPKPDDAVRRRVIFKLAEWFGEEDG